MICQKCGNNVQDGTAFCPNCGNALPSVAAQPAQPVQQAPNYQYQQAPATSISPGSILAMGIVSLAIAGIPLANIASIILGALNFGRVEKYYSEGGLPSGQVRTGRGLGKAGLIVGIVSVVFWIFYIIMMVVLIKNSTPTVHRYYY